MLCLDAWHPKPIFRKGFRSARVAWACSTALAANTPISVRSAARFIGLRGTKPDSPRTIGDIVEAQARATPDAVAFYYQNRTLSYAELDRYADRVAHWASGVGVGRGDVAALLMENRPEYVATWLGLLKVGAVAALINTNLRGHAAGPFHRHRRRQARHRRRRNSLTPIAEAVAADRAATAWARSAGGGPAKISTPRWRSNLGPRRTKRCAPVTCKDKAFYIYTSGTTGLPKAANFTHLRMLFMMHGFAGALNAGETTGCTIRCRCIIRPAACAPSGVALLTGGSLVIRRKFSVHEFWEDVHRYHADALPIYRRALPLPAERADQRA